MEIFNLVISFLIVLFNPFVVYELFEDVKKKREKKEKYGFEAFGIIAFSVIFVECVVDIFKYFN